MKFLAGYIMKGRMQATTVATSLALLSFVIPPVSIVSSASIALVTLRRGGNEGLYVMLLSSLASGLLGMVLPIGYMFALLYGLALWLPIWLMAIVLRESRQLALTIEIAVALGVLGVIGFYLYHPDPAGMWGGLLEQLGRLNSQIDLSSEEVVTARAKVAHVMTGLVAAGIVYGLLFGLFLGRWWQAALYNPGGFRTEFLVLKTHTQMAFVALISVAMAFSLSGIVAEISANIAILFFVLYTIIGTSALHDSFSKMKSSRFMVPFLYITLVMIPHVTIAVALFGLGDTWLNLRDKISNQSGE